MAGADHSKVSAIDFARVAQLSKIDAIVTDSTSQELDALCAGAQIRLLLAEPTT